MRAPTHGSRAIVGIVAALLCVGACAPDPGRVGAAERAPDRLTVMPTGQPTETAAASSTGGAPSSSDHRADAEHESSPDDPFGRGAPPSRDARIARVADLLAGLDANHDNPRRAAILRGHARAVSRDWQTYRRRRHEPLGAWAEVNVPDRAAATVLYPFAGADLPTVAALYPQASRYVLIAMQRAGRPPDLDSLTNASLTDVLAMHRGLVDAYARDGYYETRHMNEVAKGSASGAGRGLTAQLMVLAELSGFDVLDVQPIRISADGAEIEVHPGDREDPGTWSSVRLVTVSGSSGQTVLIDYLRGNLADQGLKRSPELRAWLEEGSRGPVLVKAASHLMQTPEFSEIRDLLLRNATSIVQDETGVDVRLLAEAFELRKFGDFRRVNGNFPARSQRHLLEAFAAVPGEPLPVSIGYRKYGGSCLLVASSRKAALPDPTQLASSRTARPSAPARADGSDTEAQPADTGN